MNLLELTLQGSVLIGAILLLRLLGRYRLPGWTFRILWGVALVRLLVPLALPFPWNVYSGLEHLQAPEPAVQTAPDAGGALTQAVTPSPMPDLQAPAVPSAPALEGAAPVEIPWLTILYLAGAAALALLFLASYWRGVRVFRTALPLTHPAVNQWRRKMPALRGVPIRRCDRIRTPLTYGLVRPVILLPKGVDCDDTQELGYILLHEGAHIRHRDAWWKLLFAAALCVHWFNPLVWCMYVCAGRDLERCCDEAVVRACGLEARSAYALTLLKWEERRSGLLPLCSPFSNKIMKERVISIMKLKKQSAAAIALALVLVTGTTVAFATSPAPEMAGKASVSQETQNQTPDTASPDAAKPNTIIAAAGVKPELDSPKPEIDSTIQPQTAEPAAEPEDVSLQVPGEPQVSEPQVPTQTEEPLVDRWNLPEGDLPEGLEIPVATLEEKEALSNYLHQVRGIRQGDLGYVTYDDGQMAVRVTYVWEEHPTGEYPVNSKGETYGALGDRRYTGEVPDLIGVGTDDGGIGYVTYEEYVRGIHLGYPGNYNSAEEMATTYEEWCKLMPLYYSIPVYDVEHEQVVGQFSVYNPDSYDRTQESIEEELETVAGTLKNTLGWSEEEIQNYIQQRRDQYAR